MPYVLRVMQESVLRPLVNLSLTKCSDMSMRLNKPIFIKIWSQAKILN